MFMIRSVLNNGSFKSCRMYNLNNRVIKTGVVVKIKTDKVVNYQSTARSTKFFAMLMRVQTRVLVNSDNYNIQNGMNNFS